jgi:hypothetical protein
MKNFRVTSLIVFLLALGSGIPAHANLAYTCDPNINTTVPGMTTLCTTLQNTLQPLYNNTFKSIANGNYAIYIQFGNTGLGQSTTGFQNSVSYSLYATALGTSATASGNPIQTAAVSALSTYDKTAYSTPSATVSGSVNITSALGTALGFPDMIGTTSAGAFCVTPGVAPCYNGIITIVNTPSILYFRTGPAITSTQYDFYGVVEHETDEVLGTSSCISTTGAGNTLVNSCAGTNTPSAVDLFRYQSAGNLVLDSALSTTPGAYFSYNGGTTNGASGKYYNTLANGADYADFASPTPCQFQLNIQDAYGCPGQNANVDITNDGGAEINILNAVGYQLAATPASLSISATHSTPIFKGGPAVLTLTVTNTGGPTVGAATITDTIDTGFANGSGPKSCTFASPVLTCTIPPGSSFSTMSFNIYATASLSASSWTNSPTLTAPSDTVTGGGTASDLITVSAAAPQKDASLTQVSLSGSTDVGPCVAGGWRTLTATAQMGNTSLTTLSNPYATMVGGGAGITLTNGNTLQAQIDPASLTSGQVLPFYFKIQLANCNPFSLTFDVNSN